MDINNILELEKTKALNIIKLYNTKYKTHDYKQLIISIEYLDNLLKNETNNENKKIIEEDIKILKEYL